MDSKRGEGDEQTMGILPIGTVNQAPPGGTNDGDTSDALCPLSGGSCGDVLHNDYALIFGKRCIILCCNHFSMTLSPLLVQVKAAATEECDDDHFTAPPVGVCILGYKFNILFNNVTCSICLEVKNRQQR
ncbi:hypothetical protein COLO4_17116 [Corchorus olitorius]|uniref:Uncharacterized protein n=1 Tax=Corchorus olitorius TaxID=93759 RepID=A0A1R3JE95_9ROSI|nr:hypothetical protein COLO4_17116 [Corchorus olitorius]